MSECNGICLTAGDLGLGLEAGFTTIAYPHPECPEHGYWNDENAWAPLTPEEEEELPRDSER